jgi:isopenicillin-N epimerase
MSLSRRTFIKGTAAAALMADLAFVREATAAKVVERAQVQPNRLAMGFSKDDYSLDPSVLYLNHGSIGTVPNIVLDAHMGYLRLCETNPWLYMWSAPWVAPVENIRGKAARLMGCDPGEMVLNHNTTELFNLLANGLPLGSGDEVLYSSLNHMSASTCWHNLAPRRGFSVRDFHFPISDCPSLTAAEIVSRYEAAIGPKTRVLILPHVDNTVGILHPLKEIAQMAHERGVQWVVVDGAQVVGMVTVDMHSSGVDAYATSAHKWIQSPKGLGLGYLKRSLQADLDPMWVKHTYDGDTTTVQKYEDYSTRALPALMALGDALDFHAQVSMGDRVRHHHQLWTALQKIVANNSMLEWRSPTTWDISSAIYSIEVLGETSGSVSTRIYEEYQMVVRPFSTPELNALRVSPNLMNNVSDLERFAEALTG